VTGAFGNPDESARDISFRVQAQADVPKAAIHDLIRTTDSLTEIQNTVHAGCAVRLEQASAGAGMNPVADSPVIVPYRKLEEKPRKSEPRASVARSAAGRPANDSALAAMSGTRLTRAASARPV
jgi:hypothetical protein